MKLVYLYNSFQSAQGFDLAKTNLEEKELQAGWGKTQGYISKKIMDLRTQRKNNTEIARM